MGDVVVTEPFGQSETVQVEIPVTLSVPATGPVSIDWRTVAGTAGSADFVASSGRLTLAAGSSAGEIVVTIRADRAAESPETFAIELTAASGATLADAAGSVTIRDGAKNGGVSVGDVTVLEPDAGTAQVAVPLTIAIVPTKAVGVTWELRSATGTTGSDVVAASGTTTIPKGALTAVVRIGILGDTTVEPDETVDFVVTSVKGAALADGLGSIGIRNGDLAPPPTPTPTPTPKPTPTPTPARPTPRAYADTRTGRLHLAATCRQRPGAGHGPLRRERHGRLRRPGADPPLHVGEQPHRCFSDRQPHRPVDRRRGVLDASLVEPAGSAVVTGFWANLPGYTGGNAPALRFFGEGRSCISGSVNRFAVDEVTYNDRIAAQPDRSLRAALQRTAPPLLGFLRFDVNDPTTPPPPGDPAAFSWAPPSWVVPTSGNYLYYESQPGDYIGQGQTRWSPRTSPPLA